MGSLLAADFKRAYAQNGYRGRLRKVLHTLLNPGFQAILAFRAGTAADRMHLPFVSGILQRLAEAWTGISIPAGTAVGPGLLILHCGGIVVHSGTVMGAGCTLHHNVTIGNRVSGGKPPVLGNNVMVGAGACILGDINIGDNVKIGANSVVLDTVPADMTAAGNPASIKTGKGASDPS